MTKKIKIVDALAGTEIEREMTAEELAEHEREIAVFQEKERILKEEATELRAIKIKAYEKLGLSEAEIEALLPSVNPLLIPPPA